MSSLVPAVVEKHLDSILHWNDGTFVLTSSNLIGRYWSGSVWCFKSADDAPNVRKCLTGVETDSGVCDAVGVEQNKVIIGTDSGSVELLEFQTNGEAPLLNSIFYCLEHDDLVSCVDVSSSKDKAVSCSYDKSIKIWDLISMASIGTYRPAHTDLVWRVSCCPVEPEVFLSCGQDGKILLWDQRLPKPATELSKDTTVIPTSVAWKPGEMSQFAVGNNNGQVLIKDIRGSVGPLSEINCHTRPIFRLVFSQNCPSLLASCANEPDVIVMNVKNENSQIIYKDTSHEDFVRGLSWEPKSNRLYSCGWDKLVKSHIVSNSRMEFNGQNP